MVFLHHLLPKQFDLLTLFNLIRYLLLVGFPLTVYWFVWLVLFFGRHTWGGLTDFLPMHERLHFHRFIGGVHLARSS